jgi:sugar transferase (PEP-CTERM/EpsH1 system associated)
MSSGTWGEPLDSLLFLSHRLPFPPNKGDKVRSYHVLRHLAERYRIFLGTFIDDPADRDHVASLAALCAGLHVETLDPRLRRLASASALLAGEALTLSYFRSRALGRWVRDTVSRERIARAYVFSSPMVQHLLGVPRIRYVADFVDVDSAKWDAYASRHAWPASVVYRREARRLRAYERHVAGLADAVVFVTDEEAKLFTEQTSPCACPVATMRNGVDSDHFSPVNDAPSPFDRDELPIVFTGAMDYWPNVDAVSWFAREVLPHVRRRDSRARFHVVGMNPTPAVRALACDAVAVTGRVPDVRPYLQHARVVVAPLRVARGIQNKVLEAMAMAKPIVVTPAIAASLALQQGVELAFAMEAEDFAARVVESFEPDRAARMGALARARVVRDFGWDASFRILDQLLGADTQAPFRAQPANDDRFPVAVQ